MSIFSFDYEGKKVMIENGKEAYISSIHQTGTYNGMMCGYPNEKTNTLVLESSIRWAKQIFHGYNFHLIQPTQMPIKQNDMSLEELLGILDGIEIQEAEPLNTETDNTPVSMIAFPAVVCCATLMYDGVFRDTFNYYSVLHILWFQDDYAFPIDAEILEKIKQIPFGELCVECEY